MVMTGPEWESNLRIRFDRGADETAVGSKRWERGIGSCLKGGDQTLLRRRGRSRVWGGGYEGGVLKTCGVGIDIMYLVLEGGDLESLLFNLGFET
jgi:hypothetical protein